MKFSNCYSLCCSQGIDLWCACTTTQRVVGVADEHFIRGAIVVDDHEDLSRIIMVRTDNHVCETYIHIYVGIYYYTLSPLNLANNKQASKQQASKQQASKQASNTSPFHFRHCSASLLRALLYSSHPTA